MRHILPGAVRAAAFCLALAPLAPAHGAGQALRGFAVRDSYQIGEGGKPVTQADRVPNVDQPSPSVGAGPIRLARFSYVKGNVTWRTSDGAAWSPASVNLPIRQGAQVWVTDGGRAEVQFDDGSLLRLGSGAVVTLQTLFSDADGEFTELQMSEGLTTLELRASKSIYQVNTPLVSIKSEGPSKVRIGVDSDVEVAVQRGRAAVEGSGHKTVLEAGGYLDIPDADAAFSAGRLPDADSWDRWNDGRDRQLADADSGDRLPANIDLVAGDLGDYGVWHDDSRYGQVWCPAVADAGWRPYQHGTWTWVEPFGWTWVSSEAWGWAPYHYGTWVSEPYGWAWVPGPARQPWCPAVVHFSEYGGAVAWAPLAPSEVRYSSLGYGRGGGWSLSFAIGQAAVYYPYNDSYCEARSFNNVTVNQVTYVNNVTNVYNINNGWGHPDRRNTSAVNRNVFLSDTRFIPFNARNAAGVTTASLAAFGGRGEYQAQPRSGSSFFLRGRSVGAPAAGAAPFAGPISARPTAMAFTPSRTFLSGARPDAEVLRRPLYRAALPAPVARFAPPLPRSQPSGFRPGAMSFPASTQTITPGAAIGAAPLRSSRRPARSYDGTPNPSGQDNGARQSALDARRSLGQPPSDGPRPGAITERRSQRAPFGGENAPQSSRPVRVFPSSERPQEAPREPIRIEREAPREPARQEPARQEPTRERRPSRQAPASEARPEAPAPEQAPPQNNPSEERRQAPPENKPVETKPAPPEEHTERRPGGRMRD